MISQEERSLFPSCRLYHEEIGIHTLEFLYHFDPVHEKDVMNWIWNGLLKNAPHRSDKTGLANLMPGLNAQIFRTNAGFFLRMMEKTDIWGSQTVEAIPLDCAEKSLIDIGSNVAYVLSG